jgi:hypothetical protein
MLRNLAIAAVVLATASQASSCGGGSHGTAPGASPATVTCTEAPAGSLSGITISKGIITGTMNIACTGGSPFTYDFTMILVHNQTMLSASGNNPVTYPPGPDPTPVTRIAACAPGTWHIYYLVTWTIGPTTVHNTTTTTSDRQVVLDDC